MLYYILILIILLIVLILLKNNKKININKENIKLKDILEDIINGKIVISYAYLHPLNFIRIVIKKFDDGSQLRLHFWLGNSLYETPHDHRFSFKSYVLKGKLINLNYYVKKDNLFGDYNLYETKFNSDGSLNFNYNNLDSYSIHICDKLIVKKNDSYKLNAYIIHNSIIESDTITLMYQYPNEKDHTLIYKHKQDKQLYENNSNAQYYLTQEQILFYIKKLHNDIIENKIQNVDITEFCKK